MRKNHNDKARRFQVQVPQVASSESIKDKSQRFVALNSCLMPQLFEIHNNFAVLNREFHQKKNQELTK